MTFNQIDACAKLVQNLAQFVLPVEGVDDGMVLIDAYDAHTIYAMIEEAREIVRHKSYVKAAEAAEAARLPDNSLSTSRFIAECNKQDEQKKLL